MARDLAHKPILNKPSGVLDIGIPEFVLMRQYVGKMCNFAAVMATVAIILHILFVLCLASSVVPRSVGLVTADDKPAKRVWIPLMFGISQGVMAILGYNIGRLISHLFTYIAGYMTFAMMLIVAVKLFVDSMHILKGKMLYTIGSEWDFILLSILAAINTLLMSLMCFCFMPFGEWYWFVLAVFVAGFLWAWFTVRINFKPEVVKKMSFVEFSASVFMVVLAILYLFTDLMK